MEIFREGWQWANEQTVKFWWRSGSRIRIRIRIATLVRRALPEVCTVQVPLVIYLFIYVNSLIQTIVQCRLRYRPNIGGLLWPPCVADADIIFLPCGFFFLLF